MLLHTFPNSKFSSFLLIKKIQQDISKKLNINENEIKDLSYKILKEKRGDIYICNIKFIYKGRQKNIYGYSKDGKNIHGYFIFEFGKNIFILLEGYLINNKENIKKFLDVVGKEELGIDIEKKCILDGNIQNKQNFFDSTPNNIINPISCQIIADYSLLKNNKAILQYKNQIISEFAPFGFSYFDRKLLSLQDKINKNDKKYFKYQNINKKIKFLKEQLDKEKIEGFPLMFINNNKYLKTVLLFINMQDLYSLKTEYKNKIIEYKNKIIERQKIYKQLGLVYVDDKFIDENKINNKEIKINTIDYIDIVLPEIDEKFILKHKFIYPRENLFIKKNNKLTIRNIDVIIDNNFLLKENKENIELYLDMSKVRNLLLSNKYEEIKEMEKNVKEYKLSDEIKKAKVANLINKDYQNIKVYKLSDKIKKAKDITKIKSIISLFTKQYKYNYNSPFIQYIYNHIKVISNKSIYLNNLINDIDKDVSKEYNTNNYIINIIYNDGTKETIMIDKIYEEAFNINNLLEPRIETLEDKELSVNPIYNYLKSYNSNAIIYLDETHYLYNQINNEDIRNKKLNSFIKNIEGNGNTYNYLRKRFNDISFIYTTQKNSSKIWNIKEGCLLFTFNGGEEVTNFINKYIISKNNKYIIPMKVKKYIDKIVFLNNPLLNKLFENNAFNLELTNIFINNLLEKEIDLKKIVF